MRAFHHHINNSSAYMKFRRGTVHYLCFFYAVYWGIAKQCFQLFRGHGSRFAVYHYCERISSGKRKRSVLFLYARQFGYGFVGIAYSLLFRQYGKVIAKPSVFNFNQWFFSLDYHFFQIVVFCFQSNNTCICCLPLYQSGLIK